MARDRGTLWVEQPEGKVMVGDRNAASNHVFGTFRRWSYRKVFESDNPFFLPGGKNKEFTSFDASPYPKNPPESQKQEEKR